MAAPKIIAKRHFRVWSTKTSLMEKIVTVTIYAFLIFLALVTLYPFYFVVISSISDPQAVLTMKVRFYPVGLDFGALRYTLANPSVWQDYYNTLWYTVVGTIANILTTVCFAYPISRREFKSRKFFMLLLIVPMFFGGGMIPSYMVVAKLNLLNTRMAIILPSAIMITGIIVARVFFQTTIPDSLIESAKIDGANDYYILARIVMPLSVPVISVVGLWAAVTFWNFYSAALLYLPNAPTLQPLQVYLRQILIRNIPDFSGVPVTGDLQRALTANKLKYAIIVVATVPILATYPFLQKYFVQGAMIGAVKE